MTTTRPAPRMAHLAVPVICLAQLMVVLDVAIVNIALPPIQRELGFTGSTLAWVIDAYTLTYGGLLLLGGRAADLFGRRRIFLTGTAVFTLASLLCGLATTPAVLLAARAAQGIGAAMASPAALSLITTMVPAGPARNKAMVLYGAMGGFGAVLGQVLGGVFTGGLSWRWIFLVNVPIGALLLALVPMTLAEAAGTRRSLDLPGALTATLALTSLVYGTTRTGTDGWGDPLTVGAFAAAGALLAVFLRVESTAAQPMLPLSLLRHRVRGTAYLSAMLLFACMYPTLFFSTRYLQDVLGFGPMKAGFAVLPSGLAMLACAIPARRFIARTGPRALVALGAIMCGGSALLLTGVHADGRYGPAVVAALILLGGGVATAMVANTLLAVTDVDTAHAGVASAVLGTAQQVGATVGIAVLATVAAQTTTGALEDGAAMPEALTEGLTTGCAAIVAVAITALAVTLAGRPRRYRRDLYTNRGRFYRPPTAETADPNPSPLTGEPPHIESEL
ncbi:MFS transporter [Nocardia nova]|uniref:MFS transporter n=1 Tax=Nocardia nova TaxID=37330 RepID=UPI0033FE24C0